MADSNSEIFMRMANAQERIASAVEKQHPGRFFQAITTGATIVTVMSFLSVVDLIIKWIGG